MNNIRAINKINEVELENALRSGTTGASWHDEYKDSAYVFVGGLPAELTEGDVITIFSQFGEIMDVNLPREKESGKRRGFGFLMYEDQRSTVLAVDNLNGADILGRTLRVDHVKQYKQKRERGEDGEWKDPEEQSLNAAPALAMAAAASARVQASDSEDEQDADLEDPMAAFFAQRRKEEKGKGGTSSAAGLASEKAAKRQRKEERARKRARKEERRRGQEDLPGGDARRSLKRDEAHHRSGDRHRSGEESRRDHERPELVSRSRAGDDYRRREGGSDRYRYGTSSDRDYRAASTSGRPPEDENRHRSDAARNRNRDQDRYRSHER